MNFMCYEKLFLTKIKLFEQKYISCFVWTIIKSYLWKSLNELKMIKKAVCQISDESDEA